MTSLRLPNRWVSPAETTRSSVRLQGALSSRLKGYAQDGRTGTSSGAHLRRYFESEIALQRHIRDLQRSGADVLGMVSAAGSVFVKRDGIYHQWRAMAVIQHYIRGPDTLHHH